jgi:hypothetical protein
VKLSDHQIQLLRSALVTARAHYCRDLCEHGDDGMETPEPKLKAAMEMLGMTWDGDLTEIFHGDRWTGNEHLKPED